MKNIKYTTFYTLLGLLMLTFSSHAQVNLTDGMVVYLPLDGNRLDFSGNNNNGAASGGTGFTADRFGNANSAASFGGTSNAGRITITHNSSLVFTTGATFSCWVRVNSATGTFGNGNVGAGGSQCIFAKAGDAGGGFWQLARFENGGLTNQIGNNSVSALTGAIQPYTLGTWFHYAVTMDASGHKIYVNGVLQSENTIPANLSAMNNRNIGIGRFISNWYPLNGAVDEFRVHNRVLNMDEITALANDDILDVDLSLTGSNFCAGEQLTFNYTINGSAAANNTYTIQMSNSAGSFATPLVSQAFVVSGSTGTVNVQIPNVTPTGSSYAFRVITNAPASISNIISNISVTGVVGELVNPSLYNYVGTNGDDFYFLRTSTSNVTTARLDAQQNGGHLAYIPNAATNALLQSSLTTTNSYIGLSDEVIENQWRWDNNLPVTYTNWLSGEPNGGTGENHVTMQVAGTWNDVNGSNARLSFMQFKPAGVAQNICQGNTATMQATALSGATYSWSGPNGFSSNQLNPTIPNVNLQNAGIYTLTYTKNGCSVAETTQINVLLSPNNLGQSSPLPSSLATGLQLHYPMDGNAQDASGNNIHGTMVGGVTAATNRFGEADKSLQLNGTNGHITVPSGVYFDGSDFTVTAWVRRAATTNWSRLFDFGNGSNSDNILLALSSGTTGRPVISIRQGGTIVGEHTSPSSFANNQWVHLTYTWSNTVGTLRVNGSIVASGTQQAPLNVVRTLNYLGRSNFSNDAFANARFDDFRMYNRVLESHEIQALVLEQPNALTATVSPNNICSGTATNITLSNTQPGVTYQMRNSATNANVGALQTGNGESLVFNTGNLTASTNFHFVVNFANGCGSVQTPDILVQLADFANPPVAINATVCNGGIMTIGVEGTGNFNWYLTPTGGTPIASITGNSYTTPFTNETLNFWVASVGGNGCESPRTQVSAIVTNPLNPPVDINTGLILHYKFDGDLLDYSGNNYNATASGTHGFVNDRNGNANSAYNTIASSTPGNNWLNSGNPQKIQQLTNQVTISFWMRQTQTWFGSSGTDGQMPLINKWNDNGFWVGLRMQNPSNMSNRVRWRVNSGTFIESNTNVPVNVWHHVVCTYDGATLRIYQNGVQTGSAAHSGTITNTNVDMFIGRQANGIPSGGITYRGQMDEVKIFNRALNLQEVQTIFNNESVAFVNAPFCDGEGNLTLTTFNFPNATYQWTGPNGFTSNLQNPTIIQNADSATYAGTYTLQVTSQGCTSPPQTAQAVIYEFPQAPTVIGDTICGSGNAVLTAQGAPAGASYRWFTQAVGGTPIAGQTGPTLTLNNLNATTSRFVAILRNGCEGPRTEVVAVYNDVIQTNLAVSGATICQGATNATIQVTASESGAQYQAFFNNNPISGFVAGGGNINIPINTTGFSVGANNVSIQVSKPGCGTLNLSNQAVVQVSAAPSANVSVNGSLNLCPGDQVTLSAPAGLSYLWSTGATTQSIVVNSAQTVTVTVTNANNCSATSSPITTTMNTAPNAQISANGSLSICQGQSVTLTASGGTSVLWSTGATTPSINVSAAGTYSAVVSNGTCSATSNQLTVQVLALPNVVANASQTSICAGQSVTLTGSGANTYSWNQGVTNGVAFTPSTTNTYTVTGTASNGCSNTANVQVVVNPLPNATFTASSTQICPGGGNIQLTAQNTNLTTYNWLLNGNTFATNAGPSISTNQPGQYTLQVTNSNGCTNSFNLTITTGTLPTATLSASSTSICAGSSQTLTASMLSGAQYTWILNGNIVAGPSTSNTFNATQAGSYQVTVTNSAGCQNTSQALVMEIIALPQAQISAVNTTICAGQSTLLTAVEVSGASYQWLLNGNPIAGADNSTFNASAAGNYSVQVTTTCSNTSNAIQITTQPLPNNAGNISGSTQLCAGQSQIFSIANVPNATSYLWTITPANAASISQNNGTSVVVNSTNTNFTLTVTPQNSCGNGNPNSTSVSVSTGGFCMNEVMFAANNTNICVNNQVTFTNYTSPNLVIGLNPVWNFGAGASPATANGNGPHTVTYSTTGLKTVTLSYQDFLGTTVFSEVKTNYVNVTGGVQTPPISGNNAISCSSNSETYTVTNTPGSSYTWSVTAPATITSGQGTASVVVNWNGVGGTLSVFETNAGGCQGNTQNFVVTISNPVNTSMIVGPVLVSCATNSETYSVTNNSGSTYAWTVPNGASIISGQGTHQIQVNFNGNFGEVSVIETNAEGCVGSEVKISVNCNVGLENFEGLSYKLYPNPTQDVFVLELNGHTETVEFELYDLKGELISRQQFIGQLEMSITHLADGVYIGWLISLDTRTMFKVVKN